MKKTGIYIHVPFCVKKCAYCDFYSLAKPQRTEDYVRALSRHIKKKASLYRDREIDSVFFGGGTPSLLSAEQFSEIFDALGNYNISEDAEITLEANPATIDYDKAAALLKLGVNRVSVGVQTLCDRELSLIGRIHTEKEAVDTILRLSTAGFENLSADLMFGLPEQTEKSLHNTIDKLSALPLKHISFYGLTLEKNTPLYNSGYKEISDEEYEKLYLTGVKQLTKNGYVQYEISNFAKPGFECRHNKKYWDCREYLAFGPAAHGFINGERYSYKKDLELYVNSFDEEEKILEYREKISPEDALEEYVMLSLRTSGGIDYNRLKSIKEVDIIRLRKFAEKLASSGLAEVTEKGFFLTPEGMRVSNEIIVEAMLCLE